MADADAEAGASPAPAADPEAVPEARIGSLIKQLGSEQYAERSLAERELLALGLRAFDAVQKATRDPDLEVATRAGYILEQLAIDWVGPDDPPEVASLMRRYAAAQPAEREAYIARLQRLPDAAGVLALCRITRFDTSGELSRRAGLAVLGAIDAPVGRADADGPAMIRLLEHGNRDGVRWARLAAEELAKPSRLLKQWEGEVQTALALHRAEPSPETAEVCYALLLHRLNLAATMQELGPRAIALKELAGFVAGSGDKSRVLLQVPSAIQDWMASPDVEGDKALAYQLYWALENEDWELLEQIAAERSGDIARERMPLYLLSLGYARQGKQQRAATLAEQAFALEADDVPCRSLIAETLWECGQIDRAAAEWRAVIDRLPLTDMAAIEARVNLATWWLHDREQYREAADLLQEFSTKLDAQPQLKADFLSDVRKRRVLESLDASREFMEACYWESEGDYQKQRVHLEQAYKHEPILNPDILIAMYRSKGADQQYRLQTRNRILRVVVLLQNQIEGSPLSSIRSPETESPAFYNLWAWLVSNTEGDYKKAVEYSRRSLELDPGNPSYLDTLARCCYAAGDLDGAIKYQKMAVEKQPMLRVMQKQLAFFEEEAAKKETGGEMMNDEARMTNQR